MSRSRKEPFCGMTTAATDRGWKRKGHRRDRAQVRDALHHGREPDDRRCRMDVWNSDKDGKQRVAGPEARRK